MEIVSIGRLVRLVNRKKKLNEKITGVYTMEDAKIQLTYKIDKDRKSTRQNSSHGVQSRMPSSA